MGHVLPRALYRQFSVLFHSSRLTKPGQESTQYASIASADSLLPVVMLHELIHYFAIQILEQDMSALKPSTEVRKLVKDDPGVIKIRMGRKKMHTIYSADISCSKIWIAKK